MTAGALPTSSTASVVHVHICAHALQCGGVAAQRRSSAAVAVLWRWRWQCGGGGVPADEQHEHQQPRRDRRGAALIDSAQSQELEPDGGDHVVHRRQQAGELELQTAHHELPSARGVGGVRKEGEWAGRGPVGQHRCDAHQNCGGWRARRRARLRARVTAGRRAFPRKIVAMLAPKLNAR